MGSYEEATLRGSEWGNINAEQEGYVSILANQESGEDYSSFTYANNLNYRSFTWDITVADGGEKFKDISSYADIPLMPGMPVSAFYDYFKISEIEENATDVLYKEDGSISTYYFLSNLGYGECWTSSSYAEGDKEGMGIKFYQEDGTAFMYYCDKVGDVITRVEYQAHNPGSDNTFINNPDKWRLE